MVAAGARAALVYVVQMEADRFDVARDIDPAYDRAFRARPRGGRRDLRLSRAGSRREEVTSSTGTIPIVTPALDRSGSLVDEVEPGLRDRAGSRAAPGGAGRSICHRSRPSSMMIRAGWSDRGRVAEERVEDQVLRALDVELDGVEPGEALRRAAGRAASPPARGSIARLARADDLDARFALVARVEEQGQLAGLVGDRAGDRLDGPERVLADVVGRGGRRSSGCGSTARIRAEARPARRRTASRRRYSPRCRRR